MSLNPQIPSIRVLLRVFYIAAVGLITPDFYVIDIFVFHFQSLDFFEPRHVISPWIQYHLSLFMFNPKRNPVFFLFRF